MNLSQPFIHRPVGTVLLTVLMALAGALAYKFLPVSPLPQVDSPTIQVSAGLPGASPETMAQSVATPLERQFGRIAAITEMTSTSTLGSTSIVLQFDLNRDINAAARDVQAAINAARSNLPANLPRNPGYNKSNPADAPILILALTSVVNGQQIYGRDRMYDISSSVLQQKISQVPGVGSVSVGGGSLPAVRVDVNMAAINSIGLGMEDIRTTLAAANANRPKGSLSDDRREWSIGATDQLFKADDYRSLIVHYQGGAGVRLGDVADVTDAVEDVRQSGNANGKPAIMVVIFRQPNANIIDTVDRVLALMPQFRALLPAAMDLDVVVDRSTTIRASVQDVKRSLIISISLVVLVVFIFLRNWRTTLIPAVVVPTALLGTFGVMYLCGYSLDNLSLMALTIATGFVVDDAIVVIENITRHIEGGMKPLQASLQGASEIGFTVLSISISLVAVFIPILMMAGLIGRLFREFAVTLSVAIFCSMILSLTTTPMMCAHLLKHQPRETHGWLFRASEWGFDCIHAFYRRTLAVVLRHPLITLLITIGIVGVNVVLYLSIPTGLFPQQDTGRLTGQITADQQTSFQALSRIMQQMSSIVAADTEDVDSFVAFNGSSNSGRMFMALKPNGVRKLTADEVIAKLRKRLAGVAGATLYLQSVQDFRTGGRSSAAQYQFTLQGESLTELSAWAPKMLAKIQTIDGLVDVNSDQQDQGLLSLVDYDRATAARLGISPAAIDAVLYDAFGQAQVSTMYEQLNQYHVVEEAQPRYLQDPSGLKYIYVKSTTGKQVQLAVFANSSNTTHALQVNHQSQFPCITISFNLRPGMSLSDAVAKIEAAERDILLPSSIHGKFAGTAQLFQDAMSSMPLLILAAVVAVYLVLGILYESLIHPITILSTIPSAGVGALLALMAFKMQLDTIGMIGILLLIGIVKKNAIMMIDFALEAERNEAKSPKEAIFQACLLRFRPITMTTMAALLGGLPLALGHGTGSEMRRPLGIAIVGGLAFSQMLTLYTTPVVYLYMDRLRLFLKSIFGRPPLEIEQPDEGELLPA